MNFTIVCTKYKYYTYQMPMKSTLRIVWKQSHMTCGRRIPTKNKSNLHIGSYLIINGECHGQISRFSLYEWKLVWVKFYMNESLFEWNSMNESLNEWNFVEWKFECLLHDYI